MIFHYAAHLRLLRKERGMTQQGMSVVLGITERQYACYETGTVDLPISKLLALCEYFAVSADYLLGLSEKR